LDDARRYVAIRADVPPGMTPLEVRRVVGFPDGSRAIATSLDGDVVGFLPEVRSRASRVAIGIGPERGLDRLAESFTTATRALETARAFGLTGPQRFEDLGLLPAVLADPAVGEQLAARYVTPLSPEIAASVRAWLAADTHVESAAERLIVHPNTLRYRLARFEELTGASLKDTRVQLETWWALQHDLVAGSKEVRDHPRSSRRHD
jgi:DNA-binding PucR family transcriptional regulator